MTTPDEPDMTAAELALGVLEGDERAAALRRVLAEPAFARAVEQWRERFAVLLEQSPAVEPGPAAARRAAAIPLAARNDGGRWRWGAAVASAVAAALLLVVVTDHRSPAPPAPIVTMPTRLIAVMQPVKGEAFGAVVTPAAREVRLSGGVDVPAGRAAELWAIGTDGVPRAAGLLGGSARRLVVARGLPLVAGTTLAVSIEPIGGSPKLTPTGPVVATGRLVAL